MSDTTNLASGIAGIDVYDHIKSMAETALPAALISLVFYVVVGSSSKSANMAGIQQMADVLMTHFDISFWAILPVIILFIFAWLKVPAIPSLLTSSFSALFITLFRSKQHYSLKVLCDMLMNGFVAKTGNRQMNVLLSRGGMASMLNSAALIILALSLGGLLIKYQVVEVLITNIQQFVNTPGKLIMMTIVSATGINFLVGEQYLSVILSGETFKSAYDKLPLDRKYLSRTLSAGGSAVNALVPWGVSGIFIAGALGVNPIDYVPFATYSFIEPIISIVIGFTVVTWRYRKNQAK